jgi:ribosome-associated protein
MNKNQLKISMAKSTHKTLLEPNVLVENITTFLDEAKAEDIVSISLAQKSALADYLVIATGRSQRHLKATAEKLKAHLHSCGVRTVRTEGMGACDWVLIDAGDVIIHLFRGEVREFYNLEKMWAADFSGTRNVDQIENASRL